MYAELNAVQYYKDIKTARKRLLILMLPPFLVRQDPERIDRVTDAELSQNLASQNGTTFGRVEQLDRRCLACLKK
jgi:hypothetical protein